MNKDNRPVNLDLTKFRFPPMAILSVCHRISGVLIFLFLPVAIYLLDKSIASVETHIKLIILLYTPWMRFVVWLMVCMTLFHLLAGIRHMIMDLGFGESVRAGRVSAYCVFGLSLLLFILTGVWLW